MLRDDLTDRVVTRILESKGGLDKRAALDKQAITGGVPEMVGDVVGTVSHLGMWGTVLALSMVGAGGWLAGAATAKATSPTVSDFEAVRGSMRNAQEKTLLNMLKGRAKRKDFRRRETAAYEQANSTGGEREIRL